MAQADRHRKIRVGAMAQRCRAYSKELVQRLGPPPVKSVDKRWSAVSSLVDQDPGPTDRLLELAIESARQAMHVDLSHIAARAMPEEQAWVKQWPGEHYRFLVGLCRVLRPNCVAEVGTFTGMGTLSLLHGMGDAGTVITYDVVPWREFGHTLLRDSDPWDRIQQRLGDLSDPAYFESQAEALSSADLIFVDAPKDGRFEAAFTELLLPRVLGSDTVLLFDDIRLMPMLQLWRDLPAPKLDVTSFAHWSGTGLVDLRGA
jgi:predicted O-methyltransferase YrrM